MGAGRSPLARHRSPRTAVALALARNAATSHEVESVSGRLCGFGGACSRPRRHHCMTACGTMAPTPTTTPGRSRGIQPGRSVPRVTWRFPLR